MNTNVLRRVFTSEESYGSTLLTVFIDRYAPDGLLWTPTTIRMEIEDDIQSPLSPLLYDRLMAALYVFSSDEFYFRLPRFIQVCNVLSGSLLLPDVVDLAMVDECAWGITEAALLRPPPEATGGFQPEIRNYVEQMLRREGFVKTPTALTSLVPVLAIDYAAFPTTAPTAFTAEFVAQEDKTEAVNAEVSQRLRELFEQLEALPLDHGNTDKLLHRVSRDFQSSAEEKDKI